MFRLLQSLCVFLAGSAAIVAGASSPDLTVDVTANPDQAEAGQPLSYVLTVRNAGELQSSAVVVTNRLDGAVFAEAVASIGSFTLEGGIIRFSIGNLQPGASATLEITVVPASAGQLIFTALALGLEAEDILWNNSITIQTAVSGPINVKPLAQLESPAPGVAWPACHDIYIRGSATDEDDEIEKIEAWVRGVKLGETSHSPFEFRWPKAAPGTYTLTIYVTDARQAVTMIQETVHVTAGATEVFLHPELRDGSFYFCFLGAANFAYSIEATSDFASWTEVAQALPESISLELIDLNFEGRFKAYRAVRLPRPAGE